MWLGLLKSLLSKEIEWNVHPTNFNIYMVHLGQMNKLFIKGQYSEQLYKNKKTESMVTLN